MLAAAYLYASRRSSTDSMKTIRSTWSTIKKTRNLPTRYRQVAGVSLQLLDIGSKERILAELGIHIVRQFLPNKARCPGMELLKFLLELLSLKYAEIRQSVPARSWCP